MKDLITSAETLHAHRKELISKLQSGDELIINDLTKVTCDLADLFEFQINPYLNKIHEKSIEISPDLRARIFFLIKEEQKLGKKISI